MKETKKREKKKKPFSFSSQIMTKNKHMNHHHHSKAFSSTSPPFSLSNLYLHPRIPPPIPPPRLYPTSIRETVTKYRQAPSQDESRKPRSEKCGVTWEKKKKKEG